MTTSRSVSANRTKLRLTDGQHRTLYGLLYPGDDLECVAIVLCGRAGNDADETLLAHEIVELPPSLVRRSARSVDWSTDSLPPLLAKCAQMGWGVVKIHSHPTGFDGFSSIDDASDLELFPGVYAWTATTRPHLSAIMLPDGVIRARVVDETGSQSAHVNVTVVGSALRTWPATPHGGQPLREHSRTIQAFGIGTVQRLRDLTVGVVGCSGTGSWTVELLARLGVGHLVLVDPDVVEQVNLNRIVHASVEDAACARPKVDVLARAVRRTGLSVDVETYQRDVHHPTVVRCLSRCDVIIGCVDSIDAREVMCRLSTYYTLPYFDVGVRLVSDGEGGVAHVVGSVNYVHPEAPSLLDRGLYSAKQLADAGLRRSDPDAYAKQLDAGYISGVMEARPAVASVNAFYASLAVNELLERLHPYRDAGFDFGVTISLTQLRALDPGGGVSTPSMARHTGRGDAKPLLGMPVMTEVD